MESSNTSKIAGIIGTITFHGIILLLLILFSLKPQLPLPPEEGILINFGDSDVGMGSIEPSMADPMAQSAASHQSASQEETPMTQDFEEAPSIAAKPKVKKKEDVRKPTAQVTPTTSTKTQESVQASPLEKPREVNRRALFPGRSNANVASRGEGDGGGMGNQGNPNGSPDSKSRIGGSTGGNGTSFSLSGRRVIGGLPNPDYGVQASGKVIVSITVDQNGGVTKATYSPKGSTTQDARLVNAALNAAKRAKFNVDNDAPPSQTGHITYIFNLQ